MLYYIILRNIASKSSIVALLGFPGAQASAAADSQRIGISSSLISNFVGIPTSTDNCQTASIAALRYSASDIADVSTPNASAISLNFVPV